MYISGKIYYLIKELSLYGPLVRRCRISRLMSRNCGEISPCDANQPLPFGFVLFFCFFRSLPLRLKHTWMLLSSLPRLRKQRDIRRPDPCEGGARLRAVTQTQKRRRCYINKRQ